MQENMSGLILIRDNPGGLLNAAVNILDLFTAKGELLVWTEGKPKSRLVNIKAEQSYYS